MKSKRSQTEQNSLSREIATTLLSYAKTQFLLTIIVACVSWIILSSLHIKYAVILSCIIGALSVIPFVGMTTATTVAALVAVFDGTQFVGNSHPLVEGIIVVIIFVIFNQAIDYVIAPYIVGKTLKINTVFLMLCILICTWMFGVIGTILATPIFLIIRIVFKRFSEK